MDRFTSTDLLSDVLRWLQSQLSRLPYGDITLTIRMHEGTPVLIERGVLEKVKPAETLGGIHEKSKTPV